MVTLDWSQPFEIMCDATDVAMGAVLGQRKDKMFTPIYYASRTLNDAQVNYATTEKEFFAMVFDFDKFRSYLIFSIAAVSKRLPWYADIAKILASGWLARDLSHYQRMKLQGEERWQAFCLIAMMEKLEDTKEEIALQQRSWKPVSIGLLCTKTHEHMLLHVTSVKGHGIDFMGPFRSLHSYEYILVVVDYVSKWVEAIPTRKNDARVVCEFLRKNIFTRFGIPRVIISYNGSHFVNKQFAALLSKYGVTYKT
nr:uncharacterized protein LOC117279580 [Nicotiana tomentosiformis]